MLLPGPRYSATEMLKQPLALPRHHEQAHTPRHQNIKATRSALAARAAPATPDLLYETFLGIPGTFLGNPSKTQSPPSCINFMAQIMR